MEKTGHLSFRCIPFMAISVMLILLVPIIESQFFTKTSKSIPRMGRRSDLEPMSRASILRALYGQNEFENGFSKEDEINQTNMNHLDDSKIRNLEGEKIFDSKMDGIEKEEPEYTSIVIENLRKVLKAYARKNRSDMESSKK